MIKTTFKVHYELGHSHQERWKQSNLFCPNCGKQTVWEEQGDGDYYYGAGILCTSCGIDWTMQLYEVRVKNWQVQQRLEHLRKKERQ